MCKKVLTIIFAIAILASCSETVSVNPTMTNTIVSPQERIESTQPNGQSTYPSKPTITPTTKLIQPSTLNPNSTSCPEQWFEALSPVTSPIYLLTFGALYTAYRFGQSPDQEFLALPSGPAESFAVSFSQDQQFVAYYLPKDESTPAELWLSDIALCNPLRIYSDQSGRIKDLNSDTDFQWGPGDKTLIFRSIGNEFPMLIYNRTNKVVEFWQGACENIFHLEETDAVVIGCSHDEIYSYLHPDGTITTSADTVKPTGDSVGVWSFSKAGDAVYVTSTKDVYLLRRDGQKIKLPLEGFTPTIPLDPDPIHWATNRNRFLLLAYDPQEKRCPSEEACWFAIDGENGEIIWWLKPDTFNPGTQWNEIDTTHPAAISADGEFVALQYYDIPAKVLLIIKISTNEVLGESDISSDRMVWPSP